MQWWESKTRSARRLRAALGLALALWPLAAGAADVPCPVGAPSPQGANFLAEVFDLGFCWQPMAGAPTYRIETRTNWGPWISEAAVSDNHIAIRRGLGDVVRVRMQVCQGSSCSAFSAASKRTFVWPDYDADGSGQVSVNDFLLLRSTLAQPSELERFQKVFGRFLVNGRYLRDRPA